MDACQIVAGQMFIMESNKYHGKYRDSKMCASKMKSSWGSRELTFDQIGIHNRAVSYILTRTGPCK